MKKHILQQYKKEKEFKLFSGKKIKNFFFVFALEIFFIGPALEASEFGFFLSQNHVHDDLLYHSLSIFGKMLFYEETLLVEASAEINTQNRFPAFLSEDFFPGRIRLHYARMIWKYQGKDLLTIGTSSLRDPLDSPYSLFFNSEEISKPSIDIKLEGERLFFRSAAVVLSGTEPSGMSFEGDYGAIGPADSYYEFLHGDPRLLRGLSYTEFGLWINPSMRIGFQDSAVYQGTLFDPYYLMNPLPSLFVQYMRNAQNLPSSEGAAEPSSPGGQDHGSLLGLFWDYRLSQHLFMAQFLIDDVSVNTLLNRYPRNPNKIAWHLGWSWDSPIGQWGLYHAGATQYTFQSAEGSNYAYTHYSFLNYTHKNKNYYLPSEEFYIGYKYGENNMAFLVTYDNDFDWWVFSQLHYATSLEFLMLGEQSPSNPWGSYDYFLEKGEGTRFLEGPTSFRVMSRHALKIPWKYADFIVQGDLGYVWNKQELVFISPSDASVDRSRYPYLKPRIGNDYFLFNVILGIKMSWLIEDAYEQTNP